MCVNQFVVACGVESNLVLAPTSRSSYAPLLSPASTPANSYSLPLTRYICLILGESYLLEEFPKLSEL